ncbi:PREDICTED: uncharacterized protein LOC108563799 [Nicrophorus vespilloides]|uniref:Uncharacterized protein LOC108563799 n=1 Tax=Nicrophorus vespilloides TaxID=110193 RepID=A0ABM1MU22_NICVS|nr:PREDICTED: uncharacterized protein LOC108563799 [Nicrophorus vespilloides]
MVETKFSLLLVGCLLLGSMWPVESGVIINKIKEKIRNIKGYFAADCDTDVDLLESSSNQETTRQTSNFPSTLTSTTTTTTTTSTEYPRIDIRGQFDSAGEVEERRGDYDDGPIGTSRQLIRVGENCPQGYKLARDRTCRRNV